MKVEHQLKISLPPFLTLELLNCVSKKKKNKNMLLLNLKCLLFIYMYY